MKLLRSCGMYSITMNTWSFRGEGGRERRAGGRREGEEGGGGGGGKKVRPRFST
jgi:hypothetical protein